MSGINIDKKVMKLYKRLCKANDKIIKREKNHFLPICVLVKKDNHIEIIGMMFRNSDEKEKMKQMIFKHIANQEIKAYILILDTKMTKLDTKTNERIVQDTSVRTIYTPKGNYTEIVNYKDGKILDTIKIKEKFKSYWDLWHINSEYTANEQKEQEDYQKFKKEHKELYKDL
jgi:hypothetical protein